MASDQTPPDGEGKTPPKRTRVYLRKARQKARRIGLEAIDDEHAARLLEELGVDVLNDDVSLIDAGNVSASSDGTDMVDQVSAASCGTTRND